MGSVCFQRLESEKEQEIRAKFRLVRQTFLADNPSVKGSLVMTFVFYLFVFFLFLSAFFVEICAIVVWPY